MSVYTAAQEFMCVNIKLDPILSPEISQKTCMPKNQENHRLSLTKY